MTKVFVFDDRPEYVKMFKTILAREGYEAHGIVVTPRITDTMVATYVKLSGARILVADGNCNDDEGFGKRVIEKCRDIPGIRIILASDKPTVATEEVAHVVFRRKAYLEFGCKNSENDFLQTFRRAQDPELAVA